MALHHNLFEQNPSSRSLDIDKTNFAVWVEMGQVCGTLRGAGYAEQVTRSRLRGAGLVPRCTYLRALEWMLFEEML